LLEIILACEDKITDTEYTLHTRVIHCDQICICSDAIRK